MNFKTPFKVLTTAALIGTLSLSAVAPGAASAAEKTSKTVQAKAELAASHVVLKDAKGNLITLDYNTYLEAKSVGIDLGAEPVSIKVGDKFYNLNDFLEAKSVSNNDLAKAVDLLNANNLAEEITPAEGSIKDGALVTTPSETEKDFKVTEVAAINAKTIEVKFNKAIKAASVADATIEVEDATISTKELSEDGKTLTLTLDSSTVLSKESQNLKVTVKDLTDLNNAKVSDYAKVVSLKDDVRPTLGETSFVDSQTLKVAVSEQIDANPAAIKSALTVTDEDGSPVDTTDFTVAYDEEDGFFTIGTLGLEAGKYTFKFTGLKDYAGNLINPNPVTKEITVAEDEVAPTIESISNVGLDSNDAGYLKVNFSEPVNLATTATATTPATVSVSLNGATAAAAAVVQVSDDKKSVVLKFTAPSTSYQTVVIDKGALTDLAGNENKKFSGSVTFKATTPVVKEYSYSVSKDKETVTFDRDLVDATNITLGGTKLNDNVETSVTNVSAVVTNGKLVINTLALGKGEYTLTLPANTVTDIADQGNKELKLKFTLDKAAATAQTKVLGFATDATGSALITGTSPVQADGFVYVKFGASVGASAVDVANYTVEGQQVFSKAVFTSTTKNIVKLTLKSDTIVKDGDYTLDIKNVKDAKEKAVKAFTGEFTFDDNTAPTFTALKFDTNATVGTTGAKLTATFSEALAASTSGTAVTPTKEQFKATVNGVVTKIEAISVTGNKIEFQLDQDKALEANDKVEITVLEDATFTDASTLANVVKGGQAKSVTIK